MVRWNFPAEIGSNERSFRVKYSVEDLLPQDASRWDKLIAADLARELEGQLGEKADTIPEMRRLLALKGYRELRLRIEKDTVGLHGEEAIRAMAVAMRAFAHERPGLSAATFRSPTTDTPLWRREGELLGNAALAYSSARDLAERRVSLRFASFACWSGASCFMKWPPHPRWGGL